MRLRLLLLLGVLMLAAVGLSAQSTPDFPFGLGLTEPPVSGPGSHNPHWSPSMATTFAVFGTDTDAALNVFTIGAGPTFADLTSPAVFGGVDNLFANPATSGGANGPIYVGLFTPGGTPWSGYLALAHTPVGAPESAQTTAYTTTATKAVGTNTERWIVDQTVTNNVVRPFASVDGDVAQAIVGFGPLTGGLLVSLTGTDSATAAANYTAVQTVNYDTAAAGVSPTPTVDYTVTTTQVNMGGSTFNLSFGIPVVLKSENLRHFAALQVGITGLDNSTGSVTTYTSPKDPTSALANYNNVNNSTKNAASDILVAATYALVMPGIISSAHKDNKFIADADANITFAGSEYALSNASTAFTYPGGGNPSTQGALTMNAESRVYAPGIGFKFGAGALHSFYFNPGTGVTIGIIPTVYTDYQSLVPDASLTSRTTTTLTDVNANGIQDNGDTIATQVFNYTGALANASPSTWQGLYEFYAAMPMAITIKPAGWIFGFTLGTMPTLLYQNLATYTAAYTRSTSTSTVTVGAAAPTPVVVTDVPLGPSSTAINSWVFTEQHRLGLNLDFGNGVTMDVKLNLVNVFVFDSLSLMVHANLGPAK